MKKSKLFILTASLLVMALMVTGCGASDNKAGTNQTNNTEQSAADSTHLGQPEEETKQITGEEQTDAESKTLVIYFDYFENIDLTNTDVDAISSATLREAAGDNNTGKLKMMVNEIAEVMDADAFSIRVNEPYAPVYDDMAGVAKQDIADNKQFTFMEEPDELDEYDMVFFVTPIWWGELPQPVHVFFQQYDFSGKTIIPIGIHRGSGFGKMINQMKDYEPDAVFLEGITIRAEDDNTDAKAELDDFLQSPK